MIHPLPFIAGFLLLCLGSCSLLTWQRDSPPAPPVSFRERELKEPLADDSSRESLEAALQASLTYLEQRKPADADLFYGKEKFPRGDLYRTVLRFRELLEGGADDSDLDRRIRENFSFWEPGRLDSFEPLLLTGYYEPVLEGSYEAEGQFRYPLYRRPDDLVNLPAVGAAPGRTFRMEDGQEIPYYSRREIDAEGALSGKGLEILWLRDPWERFVLHIQGSGQVRLPDGRKIRVGYAASNGRPYRSIGRFLIDQGFLTEREISMDRIGDFIRGNPDRAEEIFHYNERYIFFRLLPDGEGPIGALGYPLTPGRSIATDLTLFPPGALGYLVSRQPRLDESGNVAGWKPLRRFVLNQDTGAAMKGPARVDLFFGSGEKAGRAAGEMREEGRIYFLLAK